MLSDAILKQLVSFRHELHRHPEISGQEAETSRRLLSRLTPLNPDRLINHLGGHGILCTFRSAHDGPHVLVRVDMDALPMQEESDRSYKSIASGISHTCGHDGHATIGLALAHVIEQNKLPKGAISILFQPAEETGEGAVSVYEDAKFPGNEIDYALGMHNIPGFPPGEILVRDQTFACGSLGLILSFKGRPSHAAEPERGNSPLSAIREFLDKVEDYQLKLSESKEFGLITVIHIRLGNENFGITPGEGTVMLTLRAENDQLLATLTERMVTAAQKAGSHKGLMVEHSTTEHFPTTINSQGLEKVMEQIAGNLPVNVRPLQRPFRWSEDFGLFTRHFRGGMIGIGSGTSVPELHHPSYDFPDEIIQPAVNILYQACRNLLTNESNLLH